MGLRSLMHTPPETAATSKASPANPETDGGQDTLAVSTRPPAEWDNVRYVPFEDREIYLLGTAHVSRESVQEVGRLIQSVEPDSVCVELCPARYDSLMRRDDWKKMDVFRVIKENKAFFVLVQLIMSSFYRKIGEKLGVQPGAEMAEGIRQAEQIGAELMLADRDVNVTLKRVWGYLSLWQKLKLLFQLLASLFVPDKIESEDIEQLKDKDQLEVLLEGVAKSFPQIKTRLIDERDVYLAQKIREAPGRKIVAVVGAGHLPGILSHLQQDSDLSPLEAIPPRPWWPKLLKWGIPLLIIGLIIYGFFHGGAAHSLESISIWVLVNGVFSALAVSLALAHPLTIASAFVAAPLTSLNPSIAAGWVAGLVQAWTKKPTVADLEALPQAMTSVRGFWLNPVSRILLVVVLANLGSSVGTFLAGSWIAARFF